MSGSTGKRDTGTLGQVLDETVLRQHGIVTRNQALGCGVSAEAIRARLASGRWRRLTSGTYATFTGELPRPAQLWAAVLDIGRGAVLSHETAAELIGLLDRLAQSIHLSVPDDRRLSNRPGLVIHLSGRLRTATHPTRLPAQTRVEETVLDLVTGATNLKDAMSWVTMACGQRLTTPARLRYAAEQRPRLRWRAELAGALTDVADGAHSPLEVRYARHVERAHGLPRGRRQAVRDRPGGRYYDDVRYEPYGVHVELDGRRAHQVGARRLRDLRRDNLAVAAGGVVLRYGWADVHTTPCSVAVQVAQVLRLRGWSGSGRGCSPACVLLP